MTTNTTSSSSGIGFFGLLAILFIALKLTGMISWSWWLVTAPLWGPFILFFVGVILYVAYKALSA